MEENTKKQLKDAREIEQIAESSFFDFLISDKIDKYVKAKVTRYKYLLVFLGGILVSVLAYFEIDAQQTSKTISERSARIDTLEMELTQLSQISDLLIAELTSKFDEKYGQVSDLHLKIKADADQIGKSSGMLNGSVSNVNGSISSIKEQWQYLNDRASDVRIIQGKIDEKLRESEKNLEDSENVLEKVKQKLAEIDRDSLLSRLKTLEESNEKIFSLYEGMTRHKTIILDEKFEFKVSDISEESCKLHIQGTTESKSLSLTSDPTKLGKNTFIELVLISNLKKEKILQLGSKRAVTLRIFTKPKET